MPIDDNDKKIIGQLLADALKVNNTELGKQFVSAEDVTKIVTQGLEKGLAGLDEKVKKAVGDVKPDGEDDKKGDDKGDPKVAGKLAEMEAKLEEMRKGREQAEARAQEQRLEGELRQALGSAEVPAARIPHAIAYLKTMRTADGKPVIAVDDKGNPVWNDQRKGYVEALGLAEGIKAWSGTDDGKHYQPASGAGGTGDGAGGTGAGRKPSDAPKTADGKTDFSALGRMVSGSLLRALPET